MAAPPPENPRPFTRMRSSQLSRLAVVGLLLLGLQVPILLIHRQIAARQDTRDGAVAEVTSRWGGEQRVFGPLLRVPFRERKVEHDDAGRRVETEVVRHATFLPRELQIHGQAEGETRYRGIFEVPVYRADVTLSGRFDAPDFSGFDVAPDRILWERAELVLAVGDPRAIRGQPALSWNEASVPFEPGGVRLPGCGASLRAQLPADQLSAGATFRIPLLLNGAQRIAFAPVGDTTVATLASNWPDPSFEGRWLPIERRVDGDGFEARWEVSQIGRGYPGRFLGTLDPMTLQSHVLGVGFLAPVDPYRMAERSVKYELLFLALPFLAIWLFEVLAGLRIHPVQYLFVGSALCLFYLLQLSLAEHLGFALAYALAAAAVSTLITLYGRAVLGAGLRASALGGLVAGLYGYLYVLLQEQDFAFLLGSLGLFLALATAMWLTRHVDWYGLEPEPARPARHG